MLKLAAARKCSARSLEAVGAAANTAQEQADLEWQVTAECFPNPDRPQSAPERTLGNTNTVGS